MPRFVTISPTDVPGKKQYAWSKFLEGSYIAIGWGLTDYTDYSNDEIVADIKSQGFRNETEAIKSFSKFKALKSGDVVAVNNVNHGLFGVGRIDLDYKFERQKHDTGSDHRGDFYSHYRKVKWIVTNYHKTNDIMLPGEIPWTRHGTMGKLEESLPPYILRLFDQYISLDYNKIEPINETFKEYFLNGKPLCEIGDIMPNLIQKKLFSQASGSDFREYLRNLYTLERLNLIPYAHFDIEPSSKRWYFEPNELVINQSEDVELIGYEGKVQIELREHKWIERDLMFNRNFKVKFKNIEECQCCNANPKQKYGIDAIEFLELHHISPLKFRKNSKNSVTKESDVCLICPSCHRAIHKLMSLGESSTISVQEFRSYLEEQKLKTSVQ